MPMILPRTILILMLAASAAPAAPAVPAAPRTIELGLYLVDITDIDQRQETFGAEFDVIARWTHPAAAYAPAPGEAVPRLIAGPPAFAFLDSTWNPELFTVNRMRPSDDFRPLVQVFPDGTVIVRIRLQNQFRADLDFRRFPFDDQTLQVLVESLAYPSDEVRLRAETDFTGFDPGFEVPEWSVDDLTVASLAVKRPQEDRDYDRLAFGIHLHRHRGYYLWKIMLPIMVIVMISWVVFWMSEEMLGRRAGVSATGMLTVIAYQFVVGGFLPRLPYQTTLDWFMLVSLLAIAATMLVNLLGSRSGPERRLAMDSACRVIFPVIYFSAVGLVVLLGVNGG